LRSPLKFAAQSRLEKSPKAKTVLGRQARLVLAQMPDPVMVLDPAAGLVWSAKQRFDLELGVRANQLLEGINPQDRPAFMSAISNCLHNGGVQRVELRIQVSNGDEARAFEVEFALSRLTHCGENKQEYIVASLRNMEGLREGQHDLENALLEVKAADEAKGRFLADMSHELRTPLSSICGFSDMLSGSHGITVSDAMRVEYAGLIRQSADHLLSLLNDLLDLARIEAGKQELVFEPTDVAQHMLETVKLMQPLAECAGVHLLCDMTSDLPIAQLDIRAVRQMIMNLTANAITHAPRGSEIVLRLSRSAGSLRYEIKDQGSGMQNEQVLKLGERFSRNKSQRDSNGLGLSIVFGLVALHGGKHAVRSKRGQGTTMSFDLPILQKRSCRTREPFENLVPISSDSQLKATG